MFLVKRIRVNANDCKRMFVVILFAGSIECFEDDEFYLTSVGVYIEFENLGVLKT